MGSLQRSQMSFALVGLARFSLTSCLIASGEDRLISEISNGDAFLKSYLAGNRTNETDSLRSPELQSLGSLYRLLRNVNIQRLLQELIPAEIHSWETPEEQVCIQEEKQSPRYLPNLKGSIHSYLHHLYTPSILFTRTFFSSERDFGSISVDMKLLKNLKEWWQQSNSREKEVERIYRFYLGLHGLTHEELRDRANEILTKRSCSDVPEDRLVLMAAAMRYVILVNNKSV